MLPDCTSLRNARLMMAIRRCLKKIDEENFHGRAKLKLFWYLCNSQRGLCTVNANWRPSRERMQVTNDLETKTHHELPTRSLSQRGNVRFLRFQNISSTASPSFQQRFYAVQSKYCTFHDYLQNSIEHINAPSSRCDHLWANEHEYFICAETALGTINEDLLNWRLASKDVSSLNKT